MSDLDDIKAELVTARNEVTEAATVSDQARNTANEAAEYYAGMGLEGISAELRVVVENLEAAVTQYGTAGGAVDDASNVLREVTDRTKIAEAVEQLGQATEKLNGATTALQTGAGLADEALTRAQAVEHEDTTSHVLTAVNAASQAQTAVETAKTKTTEYQTKIKPGN